MKAYSPMLNLIQDMELDLDDKYYVLTTNTLKYVEDLFNPEKFMLKATDGKHLIQMKSWPKIMLEISKYIQNNSYDKFKQSYYDTSENCVKYKPVQGNQFVPLNLVIKFSKWKLVIQDQPESIITRLDQWNYDNQNDWS